ncbi:MAG: ACT domain-containing protein [Candidatus Nanopelagicales bacterium]
MPSLAVTVIGRDRPGIIAEVTGVVADLGGNLEDSSMTLLRGHFAWTLIADLAVDPTDLAGRLAHLSADDLVVSVLPVGTDEGSTDRAGYVLSVHGADQPGIVARVTSTVAAHGGNITDLSTRLGRGGLYLLVAEITLPPAVDVVGLGSELDRVGAQLGVGVTLRPADSDVL